mmetsp:Transcript_4944/g.10969  ORF Transcript_4944/g.10969 Transcript_4944/m.10969 type:complete len:108 (+) Transcript_4944:2642-2965(+)
MRTHHRIGPDRNASNRIQCNRADLSEGYYIIIKLAVDDNSSFKYCRPQRRVGFRSKVRLFVVLMVDDLEAIVGTAPRTGIMLVFSDACMHVVNDKLYLLPWETWCNL